MGVLKTLATIVLIFLGIVLHAQTDSLSFSKPYVGHRFKEGLYLNHQQLLTNNPIPVKYIITKYDKTDFDFFNKLLAEESVIFFDKFGLKNELKVEDLWGFCRRGSVYINVGDDFNRIPVMGSICHFVATITTRENNYAQAGYPYNYNYGYYGTPVSSERTEVYQFVMDFKSGKILEFTVDNVKILLKTDEELYQEYTELRKKKQKQQKFLYIRKYNEKHPLSIEREKG